MTIVLSLFNLFKCRPGVNPPNLLQLIPTRREGDASRRLQRLLRLLPPTSTLFLMSSSASTSKNAEVAKPAEQPKQDTTASLGVLEEDDEFEEFAVAGLC